MPRKRGTLTLAGTSANDGRGAPKERRHNPFALARATRIRIRAKALKNELNARHNAGPESYLRGRVAKIAKYKNAHVDVTLAEYRRVQKTVEQFLSLYRSCAPFGNLSDKDWKILSPNFRFPDARWLMAIALCTTAK